MLKAPKLFSVLELPVHVMDSYPDWLLERMKQGLGTHVVTLNAEMTMQAEANSDLSQVIRDAELVIPDGAGVVLYLRLLFGQRVKRIPGIELAETLLRAIAQTEPSLKVFFYGGRPGVAEKAAQFWQNQYPGLQIVGTHSGFHSPEELEALKQNLAALQPNLILVGLGVPRQEFWIQQHRYLCNQATWVGVGGSLDIWSGTKTRAPKWLANNNLEWLYRLYQEPWRWKRMLALPKFAIRAIGYRLSPKATVSQILP